MTLIPSGYGRLTAKWKSNGNPQPIEGYLVFRQRPGVLLDSNDNSMTVPWSIRAWVDAEGYLVDADPDDLTVTPNRWVDLRAVAVDGVIPVGWTYEVEFVLSQGGKPIYLAPFDFQIMEGVERDLMDVMPIEASAGEFLTRGPKGDKGDEGRGIAAVDIVDGDFIITYTDGTTSNAGPFTGTGEIGSGTPGRGITSTAIVAGDLVLTYSDASTQNVGRVVGANGEAGRGIASIAIVNGDLQMTLTDNSTVNLGSVKGANGDDGRGIASTEIVGTDLNITYSDNTTVNVGSVKGADGTDGTDGDDGRGIASTEIVGTDLIVSYSDNSSVNVGRVVGADGAPAEGGGAGQSTGWYRFGGGFDSNKIWINRTESMVHVIVQTLYQTWEDASRYPVLDYGTGSGFKPVMGTRRVQMLGEDAGVKGSVIVQGNQPFFVNIVRGDTTPDGTWAYAEFQYLTIDPFPETVSLAGFNKLATPITANSWNY
jgi:hypothetical protein